jgi:hypothetical protein
MEESSRPIPAFEDGDDLFSGMLEELGRSVHKCIVLCKWQIEDDDEGEVCRDIFFKLVEQEFDERYYRTFPMKDESTGLIYGVTLKTKQPDDT